MSLDSIYADDIEQGLQRWARNPGPAPDPGFSVTSFLGAGGKGLPSAALEVSGSVSDVLSAFGTAAAASAGGGSMFGPSTPEQKKQEAEARDRMLKSDAFNVGPGNVLRRKAEEFAPDPMTAHTADQVMHGLVRFGGKAVAAVGTMGPLGALVLGAEEGNTVAQRLRMDGVDDVTAAKVGAVQGGIAAVGAVLPLAGKTIAQTLGLVAVGGPGSYMAQEQLSKDILQQAGFADKASQHNPFDPLGLTLSTVIPGAFGAFHMRGTIKRDGKVKDGTLPLDQLRPEELRGLKYNDARLDAVAVAAAEKHGVPPAVLLAIKNVGEKSGPTAVSPRGAQGVMQFMPGTAKEMGLADRTDPVASIDAGARYMRKLFDAYGSWDAAVAHYNGGGTQAVIVRGGGRPTYNETAGYLDRVRKFVADNTAENAAKDPANVDAARVAVLNDTIARSLPDTPDAMAQVQRAADIVGERGGRAAEAEIPAMRDASVVFEVAPDPNNLELVGRWRELPTQARQDISQRVMDRVLPQVLEGHGMQGRVADQIGSYLDDTNPSFALHVGKGGDPLALAKELGHVFQQDSMVVTSPHAFTGGERTGALEIDIGQLSYREVEALYQRLHALEVDGQKPVGGQSTSDGKMLVLNFSDVPIERLAHAIDQALEGKYAVRPHDVYTAFPEKKDYGYGSAAQGDTGRNSEAVQRGRADLLREEASAALQRELDAAGTGTRTAEGLAGRGAQSDPSAGQAVRPGGDPVREGAAPAYRAESETSPNALPEAHSVKLAGDEPNKPGEGFRLSDRPAAEPKPDPVTAERALVELRKRESVLKSLLDCLGAA